MGFGARAGPLYASTPVRVPRRVPSPGFAVWPLAALLVWGVVIAGAFVGPERDWVRGLLIGVAAALLALWVKVAVEDYDERVYRKKLAAWEAEQEELRKWEAQQSRAPYYAWLAAHPEDWKDVVPGDGAFRRGDTLRFPPIP